MPIFRYEVTDATGKVLAGAITADSEADAHGRLCAQGYSVLQLLPPAMATPPKSAPRGSPTGHRRSAPVADMALFFRQLASLIRAGIHPYAALEDLGPRTTSVPIREAAADMCAGTHAGRPFSEAMARYPGLFAPHVVATVQTAEIGGFLEIALDEIALELEQELAFYKGTWLPKLLVLQELVAIALVEPLFPTLFPQNEPLLYVKLVLLRNLPIAALVALLVRGAWRLLHRPEHAERRHRWTLALPVFGDLARQRSLAAFVRMLRRLYAAGLMPINAWEGAVSVVPNSVIRTRLGEALVLMQKGVPLHEAFRSTGLFANETEQLLATGVVSGEVVEMLDRVAQYYQDNVDRAMGASRFWMYRLAIALFIALSGAVLILMASSYFRAVFDFTKGWTD